MLLGNAENEVVLRVLRLSDVKRVPGLFETDLKSRLKKAGRRSWLMREAAADGAGAARAAAGCGGAGLQSGLPVGRDDG